MYPDVVVGINGGYENPDRDNRAKELLFRKFVMDAAERLHKAPVQENLGLPLPFLDCPVST